MGSTTSHGYCTLNGREAKRKGRKGLFPRKCLLERCMSPWHSASNIPQEKLWAVQRAQPIKRPLPTRRRRYNATSEVCIMSRAYLNNSIASRITFGALKVEVGCQRSPHMYTVQKTYRKPVPEDPLAQLMVMVLLPLTSVPAGMA
jgi:hypothetical protein